MFIPAGECAMAKRCLTAGEITLAKTVFGDSIDYDAVRLHSRRLLPFGIQEKHQAMAYRSHTSFPRSAYSDDFSKETDPQKQSVFIHELVHVWQHQNRVLSTPKEAVRETLKHKFNYQKSYHYTLSQKRDLTSYGFEQQAAIVQDYFLLTRHGIAQSFKSRRRPGHNPQTLQRDYEAVLKNFIQNPAYAHRSLHSRKDKNRKPGV
jgi:hypothetical protein